MIAGAASPPDARATWELTRPLDLGLTLFPRRRGVQDPVMRIMDGGACWAVRTPDGPAAVEVRLRDRRIQVAGWGPGAAVAVADAPQALGEDDDDSGFATRHPLLRDLRRRFPGIRVTRCTPVLDPLVCSVLEQKVVGLEARRAHRRMVHALGEPAPGPLGLMVPPTARALAGTPAWRFHRFGVERRRAETVRRLAMLAPRVEETRGMPAERARARLEALPGVGPWTAAEVAAVALGDADAVPVGDFHLCHLVCWTLAGRARGSDAEMLDLLEPYRGHRARVVRLLLASGLAAPRFGPRLAARDIATH